MAKYSKPNLVNTIWAEGGDKVSPDGSKYNIGWLAEIPPRQYFNFIDWKQDSYIAYINQTGIPEWDNVTEYQANISIVQGSDGNVYKCLVTGTNIDPVTDTSSRWRRTAIDDAPSNSIQYVRQNNSWQPINTAAFAPAVHTHTIAQVSGLQNELNNKASLTGNTHEFTATGTNVQKVLNVKGVGSGSSSVVQGLRDNTTRWYVGENTAGNVRFGNAFLNSSIRLGSEGVFSSGDLYANDNLAHKVWHGGNFTPDNYAPVAHTHNMSQVTGLQSVLDGKMNRVSSVEALDSTSTTVNMILRTTSGSSNLNQSRIRGVSNGTNQWYVGFPGGENNLYLQNMITGTNVRIGVDIRTSVGMVVTGDFRATGNVTAYSDIRLKKNINTIVGATEKLSKITGVTYEWNNERPDFSEKSGLQTGFIAQDVEKVFPHLVKETDETLKTVNYIGLIPVLLESLKEAHEKIACLEKKIGGE